MANNSISRRHFLQALVALGAALPFARVQAKPYLEKSIPVSGEPLHVIGMGTWQTFNVGSDPVFRQRRTEVLREFFAHGGQMIDSSPMYGSSPDVVGYSLEQLGVPSQLFSAEKVWTSDGSATREALADSLQEWRLSQFDLYQVHNLLSWREHLETLYALKEEGKIRYVGITTSHGRRHGELESILENHSLDFVQLTYNILDREVENRLLPLAAEKGVAVIANRPFQGGRLIKQLKRSATPPDWARDAGMSTWAEFLLKFIVSHPALTCAIPATSQVEHMRENMQAGKGLLPDAKTRARMIAHIESL